MSRISEVLVSSITPVQLMMGKPLGMTAVRPAVFYLLAARTRSYAGRLDVLQPQLIAWFLLFLVCAAADGRVAIHSYRRGGVGHQGCPGHGELAMIMVLPIMLATVVIQHPDSTGCRRIVSSR